MDPFTTETLEAIIKYGLHMPGCTCQVRYNTRVKSGKAEATTVVRELDIKCPYGRSVRHFKDMGELKGDFIFPSERDLSRKEMLNVTYSQFNNSVLAEIAERREKGKLGIYKIHTVIPNPGGDNPLDKWLKLHGFAPSDLVYLSEVPLGVPTNKNGG